MHDRLRRLRDAIIGRGREVEVDENGTVHEIPVRDREEREKTERPAPGRRATKLAHRTFGQRLAEDPDPIDYDTLANVVAALTPRSRVGVIVPSHDRDGVRIDFDGLLRATEDTLLAIARGTTTILGGGRWRGAIELTLREPIGIVEVFFPKLVFPAHVDAALVCLSRIARDGNQEAVAIIIDNRLYVVASDALDRDAA